LTKDGDITIARYDWPLSTTKTWLNILSPLAKPLFGRNHKVEMSWGAESLAKRLDVKVFEER
jgi:hypothetical protein